MEVFVNNKTIISIPLSGGWFTLPVLDIDKIPLLMNFAIEFVHEDISVFSVLSI
jgi:hypothetical protein